MGDDLGVRANNLWLDCADTGHGLSSPATQVRVVLTIEGDLPATFVLATVNADEAGTIDTTVQIPEGASAGPATLTVGGMSSITVTLLDAP